MRPIRPAAALVALLASVLVGLTTGLPSRSAVAEGASTPALTVVGRTPDGWAAYDLADGRLPEAAVPGVGFRGEVRFLSGGRVRAVRLLVPPSARPGAPLLLALHGLYQTLQTTEEDQQWGPLVRRRGVVLAYGVGTDASWDAGTCCGAAAATGVDDVAYLDRVVEVARALLPTDPARLYVTGFSNGAMMAYRYACERPDRVAAVLAVSGTVTATCEGRSDVAVLHVHGLADRTVPLAGTAWSADLHSPLRPVSQTVRWFGPRISARLLRGYGHGWPTASRGGFATTDAGWAFLAAQHR